MKPADSYPKFVDKMLDDLDFLSAPKASDLLDRLMTESGLTGQSPDEIRKHIAASVAKYDHMVGKSYARMGSSRGTMRFVCLMTGEADA